MVTITKHILTKEQRDKGLQVIEPDDHFVLLTTQEGKIIQAFNRHTTVQNIQEEAQKFLEVQHES